MPRAVTGRITIWAVWPAGAADELGATVGAALLAGVELAGVDVRGAELLAGVDMTADDVGATEEGVDEEGAAMDDTVERWTTVVAFGVVLESDAAVLVELEQAAVSSNNPPAATMSRVREEERSETTNFRIAGSPQIGRGTPL